MQSGYLSISSTPFFKCARAKYPELNHARQTPPMHVCMTLRVTSSQILHKEGGRMVIARSPSTRPRARRGLLGPLRSRLPSQSCRYRCVYSRSRGRHLSEFRSPGRRFAPSPRLSFPRPPRDACPILPGRLPASRPLCSPRLSASGLCHSLHQCLMRSGSHPSRVVSWLPLLWLLQARDCSPCLSTSRLWKTCSLLCQVVAGSDA